MKSAAPVVTDAPKKWDFPIAKGLPNMSSFTKLHDNILTSTIWREDPATKVVWITLLAMADQDGVVESTLPGLAALANVSLEQAEQAIRKFLSPDKYSRTPDFEGRRIEDVAGGWRLLNYENYRFKLSLEYRRERARVRQQRHRARVEQVSEAVTGCDKSVTVTPRHQKSHQAEAEAEVEAKARKPAARLSDQPPAKWIPVEAWAGFDEMRKKIRAPMTHRAAALVVKQLEKLKNEGFDVGEVLDQSTRNNWKDVYPLKGNESYGNSQRRTAISRRAQEQYDALADFKRAEASVDSGIGDCNSTDDGRFATVGNSS